MTAQITAMRGHAVASEWDISEHGALQAVYREHVREMTTARQAAERLRGVRSRDPVVRRTREETFIREMARIEGEHQAWMQAHGLAADLPVVKSRTRSKNHMPPE